MHMSGKGSDLRKYVYMLQPQYHELPSPLPIQLILFEGYRYADPGRCPECGELVSDKEQACPRCREPLSQGGLVS